VAGFVKPRPRQASPRFRRRVEVRYVGGGRPERIGYSGNISLSGMMLRTPVCLPPGTILTIDIHFPAQIVRLEGRVMWAREGPMTLLSTGRIGMGIRFIEPPEGLAAMISNN
jgi:hypothetical protein